MIEYC